MRGTGEDAGNPWGKKTAKQRERPNESTILIPILELQLEPLDLVKESSGDQAKFKVEQFITTDGYKFLLSGGEWVAFRASGTEPMIRCYIEAKSEGNLKLLQTACRKVLA